MKVGRSGYYAWKDRPQSPRSQEREKIGFSLLTYHQKSRGIYGLDRLHQALKRGGITCSRNRVRSIMIEFGIRSKIKKKFKATTLSKHKLPTAPNLLERKFNPPTLNSVWASDITYIWTKEGWLFLGATLDLSSRKVVGWSVKDHMKTGLVLEALNMALKRRDIAPGLLHHSDQGVQYASKEYQEKLAKHQILSSMSRKGECYDNAVVESFFHTLKTELIYLTEFETKRQAIDAIFEYIEVFYNRQRLHSSLGYMSPHQFEETKKVA